MNPDWKAFLSKTEFAELTDNQTQQEMLFDLSGRGIIKVTGDDAESFLQNQLTNDVRNVTETTHQASAWCSPKGRIIANFQIFKREDSYFLIVSADLIDHVIKKLSMYVMMSKVTLEDATDSLVHFGYAGDLQNLLSNAPSASSEAIQLGELSVLKLAGDQPRFEIFSGFNNNLDEAKQLWDQCKAQATPVTKNGWDYLNISAGTPEISEASSEAWIPQMVNYIAIGGVDFKKGCYPGQEVVARLNYLGKTKRRMYRLLLDTGQLPAIGDAISNDSDKEAGKILNAAINPDGKVEALAIMKISEADTALHLSDKTDTNISLLELPYSVDDA